jgi:hypothetical protein
MDGRCATKGWMSGTHNLWFGADIPNNRLDLEQTRPACAMVKTLDPLDWFSLEE